MHPVDEAWGRFAAITKYSLRRTLAQATGSRKAVLLVASVRLDPRTGMIISPLCEVCRRPLQIGYKVMLATNRPREWTTGYVHEHPRWCRVALGEGAARPAAVDGQGEGG